MNIRETGLALLGHTKTSEDDDRHRSAHGLMAGLPLAAAGGAAGYWAPELLDMGAQHLGGIRAANKGARQGWARSKHLLAKGGQEGATNIAKGIRAGGGRGRMVAAGLGALGLGGLGFLAGH